MLSDAWIIYFWQGRDSSSDEKGAAALLTVDLDNSLGGEPVQVRVVQGSEPPHFLALFKGKLVISDGGYASAFGNSKEEDVKAAPVALYHIHGSTDVNTYAIQTGLAASSLNSGDCFALNTSDGVYVWIGAGANAAERKAATSIAAVVGGSRKQILVEEGKEPEAFWTALGGKGEYPNSKELVTGAEPRLFHCTTAKTGAFKIEEIFNFVQDDLINDDVLVRASPMLLLTVRPSVRPQPTDLLCVMRCVRCGRFWTLSVRCLCGSVTTALRPSATARSKPLSTTSRA
jgi:advillin